MELYQYALLIIIVMISSFLGFLLCRLRVCSEELRDYKSIISKVINLFLVLLVLVGTISVLWDLFELLFGSLVTLSFLLGVKAHIRKFYK